MAKKKKTVAKKRKGPILVCQGFKPVGIKRKGGKSVKIGYITPIRCRKISRKKVEGISRSKTMTAPGRFKKKGSQASGYDLELPGIY